MKDLPQVMASLKQALSEENMKRLSATVANMEKASGEVAPLIVTCRAYRKLDALLGETGEKLRKPRCPG